MRGAEHSSYLLPPARCAERSDAPCEAMRRAVRRDAPPRATRCEVASEASCPAERSIVHCPLSIVHCPLSLVSSHCKVTTRDGRNQAFGPNDAARPRVFLLRRRCSALIVNHLVANGQKGQRADGLWLMRGGGQVARRGWASGQSGHLVIWSKSILDRQKTPL